MCSYHIAGKLTVIKFGSLPSKCISLILRGYNLTDWSSTIIFVQSKIVTVDIFLVKFHVWSLHYNFTMGFNLMQASSTVSSSNLIFHQIFPLYGISINL